MKLLSTFLLGLAACAGLSAPSLSADNLPPSSGQGAAAASSESAYDDWVAGKTAMGAFGGMRTQLEKKGIEFFAFYNTDIAGNFYGGQKEGNATYTDDIFFGVNLYFDKMFGWHGARLYLSGIRRSGRGLTNRYVRSLYNAQQDVGGQNIFLYQVAFEQLLFDDKFSVKLGRFSASDDFNNSPIYNLYMTNGIDGDVRNVLFDTQFSAYPFNTWALRTVYYPIKEVALKLGVFQTTSNVFARSRNGVDWDIRGDDGVFLVGQVNWSPEFGKQAVQTASQASNDSKDGKGDGSLTATEMKGLPGHYNIGGTFSPWKGYSKFSGGQRSGSFGFFAHADQMVYQEKPGSLQGLTLWAAGGVYPQRDISIIPYQAEGGLIYEGLFPSRDKDKVILGIVYGKFSSTYADIVAATNGGHAEREMVYEAGYRLQLTQFFYVQPDFQFYSRPFGTGRIKDAAIAGTQIGVVF